MFTSKQAVKIKNDKIQRRRVKLSFDIKYCLGRDNVTVDTLSRTYCSVVCLNTLEKLCNSLCHHGIT